MLEPRTIVELRFGRSCAGAAAANAQKSNVMQDWRMVDRDGGFVGCCDASSQLIEVHWAIAYRLDDRMRIMDSRDPLLRDRRHKHCEDNHSM